MIYDPKSPTNLLPPYLRFMCRVLGLLCLISWICTAVGLVLLGFAVVMSFVGGVVNDRAGFGVSLILLLFAVPLSGLVFGLRSADRLFIALRRGDYFAPSTAKALKHFALGMLLYFLTPPLIMLLVVGADLANIPTFPQLGKGGFEIKPPQQIDGINAVLLAVFLGSIVLFASIWERAVGLAEESRRLADENAQFV